MPKKNISITVDVDALKEVEVNRKKLNRGRSNYIEIAILNENKKNNNKKKSK